MNDQSTVYIGKSNFFWGENNLGVSSKKIQIQYTPSFVDFGNNNKQLYDESLEISTYFAKSNNKKIIKIIESSEKYNRLVLHPKRLPNRDRSEDIIIYKCGIKKYKINKKGELAITFIGLIEFERNTLFDEFTEPIKMEHPIKTRLYFFIDFLIEKLDKIKDFLMNDDVYKL